MKKMLVISSFIFAIGSANASTHKEFDGDALQLLTAVFNNLPIHFQSESFPPAKSFQLALRNELFSEYTLSANGQVV